MASTSPRRSARNVSDAHDGGIHADLPAAVHVVEEGLHHRRLREHARGGQDVERDLELLAAAEEPAVVAGARPVL